MNLPRPVSDFRSRGRSNLATPLVVAALALAVAMAARHGLVEPAALTARCDAAPWQGFECSLRTLIVQAFVGQRIGVLAVVLALLATVMRWRAAAIASLMIGSAGMVLYSLTWAAPAVLLAGLVLVRPRSMPAIVESAALR